MDDIEKRVKEIESRLGIVEKDSKSPIKLNDIPQGASSKLDSDTVDSYHASQYPAPNAVPVLDDGGKIHGAAATGHAYYMWLTFGGY